MLPLRSVVVTAGMIELVPEGWIFVDVYVYVFPLRSVVVTTGIDEPVPVG